MKINAMRKFLNAKEIIIIFLITTACIIALLFINNSQNGKYAVISVDGAEILKISLSENKQNITLENTENIVFEVKNGEIFVAHTDCPDEICLKTGAISRKGQTIVCLPKKITVKIIGTDSDADVVVG